MNAPLHGFPNPIPSVTVSPPDLHLCHYTLVVVHQVPTETVSMIFLNVATENTGVRSSDLKSNFVSCQRALRAQSLHINLADNYFN